MIYARTPTGLVLANKGMRATCPSCGREVVAKCGTIKVWHWAHAARDCDPWSEPESAWHVGWKQRAPIDRQEVIMQRDGIVHRADVVAKNGSVLELQASTISVEEIQERERFYGRMAWLFRCTWANRLHFGKHGFWWKHGALSQVAIIKPLFWHVNAKIGNAHIDRVWQVKLARATEWNPYIINATKTNGEEDWGALVTTNRVLGKVVKEWPVDEFARLSIEEQ